MLLDQRRYASGLEKKGLEQDEIIVGLSGKLKQEKEDEGVGKEKAAEDLKGIVGEKELSAMNQQEIKILRGLSLY